ncbi:DUF262 domain-containing protein, partial [Corynebacterium sp.]|uniref:DUF262 domain-containing protein n=1 Tax=Corynebacterium sp. TaxID=1720 RepID=UPI002A9178CC
GARTNRESHFFGSVVGNPEDSFTWVVIDGQQRLTTVSVLILALVHAVRDGEVEEPTPGLTQKLMNNYLLVSDSGEQKFKLKPIKDDQDSYSRLFGDPAYFNEGSNLTANYSYFRERLRETDLDADQLWNQGISRLEVMHLDLEPKDDPQRIFETLNSTGLALKESDKIRNLVLMGLPHREQELVYEKFWNAMEKNVEFRTDSFIRWFLTAQTSKTPKESEVFEAFKVFVAKSPKTPSEIVEELHQFSTYAKALAHCATGYSAVDRRLKTSNRVIGDVVKPFLWLTYRDLKAGIISEEDFASMLAIIETYVFRRVIASVASNSLNKTFATAYSELRKQRRNDEPYSDILAYMLLSRGHSGRFPADEEFVQAFRTRDAYHMKSTYRQYLFHVLERGHSKDVADIAAYIESGELTIEHIMPQTLSNAWRDDLGPEADEIHRTWVNRIANLTVTGYNSQYSNSSFAIKKEMPGGFSESPYVINNYVKAQTSWGLDQLTARANELDSRALELWPLPQTDFTPVREVLQSEPLGEDTDFAGVEVSAVEIGGAKTPVQTWTDVLSVVLRALLEADRDSVLTAAKDEAMLAVDGDRSTMPGNARIREIDPALRARVNSSTTQKAALIRRMCAAIEFDPDEIILFVRDQAASLRHHDDAASEDNAETDDSTHPYVGIVALLPLIDEVEGSVLEPAETAELREQLRAALTPYLPEDPQVVLGGQSLETFLGAHSVTSLSASEVFACFKVLLLEAQLMGDGYLHRRIIGGEIGPLLRRLGNIDQEG